MSLPDFAAFSITMNVALIINSYGPTSDSSACQLSGGFILQPQITLWCQLSDGSYYSPISQCGVSLMIMHARKASRPRASRGFHWEAVITTVKQTARAGVLWTHEAVRS